MTANNDAILNRLNGDFRRVAEIVGVENALKLAQEFGGLWISIPKLDNLKREIRDAKIRAIYDHTEDKTGTVRSLARKHDLTARQIYNILGVAPAEECNFTLPLFFNETQSVK